MTLPQQLHLPRPAPPPGGETCGVASYSRSTWGQERGTALERQSRWQGQLGGRVTDGGRSAGLASGTCRAQSPWALPPRLSHPRESRACCRRGAARPGDPAPLAPAARQGGPQRRRQGLGGLASRALTRTLHTGTAEGTRGLLHVGQNSFPPPARKVTCSSSAHFTENETEARKSETGHLVTLMSRIQTQNHPGL